LPILVSLTRQTKPTTNTRGKKINTEFLNAVQKQLIDFANANGINLANEFKSVEEFKNFVFSFAIKSLMDIANMTVNSAYDFVMGDGSFQSLCDEVWAKLNDKVTA